MTTFDHGQSSRVTSCRDSAPVFDLSRRLTTLAVLGSVAVASCTGVPPTQSQPLTQQRPLTALLQTAAYPNSDIILVADDAAAHGHPSRVGGL
jgi:hypothetical protein